MGHKLLGSKVSENTLCSNYKRATQTEKCFRKHLANRSAETRSISVRQERNFSGKKKGIAHKEFRTGFMLIAFKSQLTGSVVIRVPLQDVKIHLIQIHFSYLKLVDKTVYQLNVTRAELYALSLANVISKLVTVYSP